MASAPFPTIPLDPDLVERFAAREPGQPEGDLDASLIPDHRALGEERVDELIRRSFGEGGR